MKLNMGCGSKRIDGFLGVDKFKTVATDILWDLEATPWPWESNSVSAFAFIHCLEHLGGDTPTFLNIIKEIQRVAKPMATVTIHVPHPRHDNYLGDPTHVRPITPQCLSLFDRQKNEEWVKGGVSAATPLGMFLEVDLRITQAQAVLDSRWQAQLASGQKTLEEISEAAQNLNNVISDWHIECVVVK